MAVYEYHCKCCGQNFQKKLSFFDTFHMQECPYCQSEDTRRQKELSEAAKVMGSYSIFGDFPGCGSSGER